MKIRKATAGEMLELWGYPDADSATPTARFFYRNIEAGNAVFWTLDERGQLAGELYAFLTLDGNVDFADGKTTAYLCAFRVREDLRGRGLGNKLMKAALADLKASGFRRVTIGVNDERNEARYRHMGFSEKIKTCYFDPCAMDADMRPAYDDAGFLLLAQDL